MILAELNPNKNRVKTELKPCDDWYDVPSDEMTFEQAKQAVKDLRKKLSEYLEQQTCDDNWRFYYNHGYAQAKRDLSCDDSISRQAVEKITWEEPSYTDPLNVLTEIREKVRALPSVISKEKTGQWIENAPEYQNIDPPYICSECGNMHLRKTNYCDQCGARMLESQESEDCRDCKKWGDCPCGKEGHESGTSQGYSIGGCKDFESQESEE